MRCAWSTRPDATASSSVAAASAARGCSATRRRVPRRSSTATKAEPSLGDVARTFRRHAELLTEFFDSEERGCRDIRKHVAWYFKGYPVGGDLRARLATVESLAQLDELLGTLDWSTPYPARAPKAPRAAGTPKNPSLPDGWLDSQELVGHDRTTLVDAELDTSGG